MVEYPKDDMQLLEKYMYLKELEKQVKDEIALIQNEVKKELNNYENNFVRNETYGNLQRIEKQTVKPKDSLTTFLHEKGLLEICKNDSIDLQKVNQLVDAGVLSQEELDEHLKTTKSTYVKFNPNKNV